ncbi:MAG: type II 3-dehydroquinate dehydratase [Saprospiraceae bacterium]
MKPSIALINGPNLNLVGLREPEIYGNKSLTDYLEELKNEFSNFEIELFQSNHEGEIVETLQKILNTCAGIIINPAAFTHTSIAIRDVIAIHKCPIIEVHLSNINERENFRQHSLIRDYSWSHIQGMGLYGYRIALIRMKELLDFA